MGQRLFDLSSISEPTGAEQTRLLAPPRWTLRLVQPAKLTLLEAGQWTAMLARLRGRANVLAAWDPVRPAPQGTLRGAAISLVTTAAAGATSVRIFAPGASIGGTLEAGDWMQIGTGLGNSQLVMVTAQAALDNALQATVSFEPPLRQGWGPSAPVNLDKPLGYFRMQSSAVAWAYANRGTAVTGLAIDLLETWS